MRGRSVRVDWWPCPWVYCIITNYNSVALVCKRTIPTEGLPLWKHKLFIIFKLRMQGS
jgi:hypothetical protein